MMHLVFFLEEPSAREMLRGFLPKVVPNEVQIRYVVFEGKQDMEKRLPLRLRGWRAPNSAFVVLRDQDSADCHNVKEGLVRKCAEGKHSEAVVRVACRELESWYFGDLEAVEQAMELTGLVAQGRKKRYREPDKINNPSRELEKVTGGRYQKVSGSRAIGPVLSAEGNRSHSFGVFLRGIEKALEGIRDA